MYTFLPKNYIQVEHLQDHTLQRWIKPLLIFNLVCKIKKSLLKKIQVKTNCIVISLFNPTIFSLFCFSCDSGLYT